MWESLPPLVITSPGLREDAATGGNHTSAVRIADVVGLFDEPTAPSLRRTLSQTHEQTATPLQAGQEVTKMTTSASPSAGGATPRTASAQTASGLPHDDRDAQHNSCSAEQQEELLFSDQQTYERFAQAARANSGRAGNEDDNDDDDAPPLYGAGPTSYSFYKGTTGTGNLVRSFYFPSSSALANSTAVTTPNTATAHTTDHVASAPGAGDVAAAPQSTTAPSPLALHTAPSFFSPTAWDRADSFDKLRTAAPLAATSVSSVPSDTAATSASSVVMVPAAGVETTGTKDSSALLVRRASTGTPGGTLTEKESLAVWQPQSVTPRTWRRTLNELEQMLAAFKARCDTYHHYKNSCTESYLGEIEAAVDDYLVRHFRGTRAAATGGGNVAMNGLTKAGAKLFQMGNTLLRAYTNTPGNTINVTTTTTSSSSGSGYSEGASEATGNDAMAPESASLNNTVTATSSATADSTRTVIGSTAGHDVAGGSPGPAAATTQSVTALRYTADVISAHYLDERPSLAAMRCIVENYPILLYVLRNVFAPSTTVAASQPDRGGGMSDSAASTTARECRADSSYDTAEHVRLRERLFVPTIDTVWNRYLSPLEERALELLHVAKAHLQPAVEQWRRQVPHVMVTDSVSGGAGETSMIASVDKAGDDEASALSALHLHVQSLVQQVEKRLHGLRNDVQYIDTLRDMDKAFVAEQPGWREAVAQSCHQRLSDYVPVYGLLLSRLHRLEMEHRTVLEVWATALQPVQKPVT